MIQINSKILLPIAYLPSIQYFMLMATAREVFVELHETYPKQTYRNRCEIYSANGKLTLTVPVIKTYGNHTKTLDIAISYHQNWQIIHWRAIESAYAKSPYFLYYCDDLKPFFELPTDNLVDFNMLLISKLMELIGLEKTIHFTGIYEKCPTGIADYREIISPKKPFTQFEVKPYYQVFQSRFGFLPGLSIIDLLFNAGPETFEILKGG